MDVSDRYQNVIPGLMNKASSIRRMTLRMIARAGSGHPGSSLSCIDILVCLFYHRLVRSGRDRDFFILSKGHAVPALYSILIDQNVLESGLIDSLRKLGSPLQGHPDVRHIPEVEVSTGSLGQGLSVGCGIALASRILNCSSNCFVLLGDGELQEGQVWESLLLSHRMALTNLVAIVDFNKLQHDGPISDIVPLEPLRKKIESFGWNVIEIDGHNFEAILGALCDPHIADGPTAILAHTVKGKGVSYMENKWEWHSAADPKKLLEEFGSIQ